MGAASRRKRLRKALKLPRSGQGETARTSVDLPRLNPNGQQQFHSGQGEPAKMSERLIQIAQPYLNCGDDVDEYQKELSFASTAWNLSLFPPASREKHLTKALDGVALEEEDRQLILEHLCELIRRKERLFPEDRRMIAKVDVLDEGDSVRVLVMTMIT